MLYQKRQRLPAAVEAELGITFADRDAVIAESDFLCVLLPYAPETDMALNAEALATMKPGVCIVSCGSGSVIDEAALADAIVRTATRWRRVWTPMSGNRLRPDNPLLPLARDRRCQRAAHAAHRGRHAVGRASQGAAPITRTCGACLQGEPLLHRVA